MILKKKLNNPEVTRCMIKMFITFTVNINALYIMPQYCVYVFNRDVHKY